MDTHHSFQQLILELIHCKRSGWNPKMVFVKPLALQPPEGFPAYLLFIELLKKTSTGMAFTIFKPWTTQYSEKVLLLCHKVGLHFRGLSISKQGYEVLVANEVVPFSVLNKPLDLWHPETEIRVESLDSLDETTSFIEELSYGTIEPTNLI